MNALVLPPLLVGMIALAQQPALCSSPNLVVLDIQVCHRDSDLPLEDLTLQDFEVVDEGKKQTLTAVDSSGVPLDMVVVIARDIASKKEIRIGGRATVDRLRRDDRAAVISYSSRSQILEPLTSDPDEIAGALEGAVAGLTRASGGAKLFDALGAALDLFPTRGDKWRRRVIVAVSDGIDRGSAVTGSALIAKAIERDAVVNLVALRTADGSTSASNRVQIPLGSLSIPGLRRSSRKDVGVSIQAVVNETGGEFLEAGEQGQELETMFTHLRARYSLAYRLTPEEAVHGQHVVNVTLSAAARKHHPDANVRMRHSYLF